MWNLKRRGCPLSRKPKNVKTGVGLNVEKQREKKGWSQEELAKRLYMERNTLSMKECGTREFRPEELLQLSEIFGITVDELLRGVKTKSWDVHKDLGLNDQAIEAFMDYRKTAGAAKLESLNQALSNCATLDAIATYSMRESADAPHGYYLSSKQSKDRFFVDCRMSHDLFHAVLGQNLLHVIDTVVDGDKEFPFQAAEDFFIDDPLEEGDVTDGEEK